MEGKFQPAPEEKLTEQIAHDNCKDIYDSFVLLAGNDRFLKIMFEMDLEKLIQKMKFKAAFGETIDKVLVLKTQLQGYAIGVGLDMDLDMEEEVK